MKIDYKALEPLFKEAQTSAAAMQILLQIDRKQREISIKDNGEWKFNPYHVASMLRGSGIKFSIRDLENGIVSDEIIEEFKTINDISDLCLIKVIKSDLKHNSELDICRMVHSDPACPHTEKTTDRFGTPQKILNALSANYKEKGLFQSPYFKTQIKANPQLEKVQKVFGKEYGVFLDALTELEKDEGHITLNHMDMFNLSVSAAEQFDVVPSKVAALLARNEVVRGILKQRQVKCPHTLTTKLKNDLLFADVYYEKEWRSRLTATAEKKPNPSQADINEYTDGNFNQGTSWRSPGDPDLPEKW